jgi:adenine-specific DNA-methyltransferase
MTHKYDDLSREELIKLLKARERRDRQRFGLVWEADEIDRDRALNQDFVALDLDESHSCGEAPYDNLIIEGDNFDALRHLRMCYAGRVKCIYIDPPYNTGNKDFVYNDHYIDREDQWKHSKWCEFMYQRLVLAKDLLRQDGVIFVSIDDNELASLRLLMDRVFGSNNFVATCIWQKRYSASNDHKSIAPMHEYVIVYSAFGDWQTNRLPRGAEKDKQYRLEDEQGIFRSSDYTCNKSAEERPNLYYPVTNPNTGEEIWPKKTSVWRYSKETHAKNVEEGLVYWGKTGQGKVPAFKRYKHMLRHEGVVPTTWWTFDEVGHNDSAKKELMAVMPEVARAFSTPKPTGLIERVLKLATEPGDIVLDFFAGSGTTAHSVLKLNAEDGGARRFILVSNSEASEKEPDKNLCRDVCAERVRRAIVGYGKLAPLPGNFAYLRTRRIGPERMLRIEHAQVWTALQLTHFDQLQGYDAATQFQAIDRDGTLLLYVSRYLKKDLAALRTLLEAASSAVVYSWQPQYLAHQLGTTGAQFEGIPESLERRFGLNQGQGGRAV